VLKAKFTRIIAFGCPDAYVARFRSLLPGSATSFLLLFCCVTGTAPAADDAPEVTVGGRLFVDTRFSQYFFAHSNGDVNVALEEGDPVMETSPTTGKPLRGAFAGQSMNCRSCHLVNEFRETGMRTYADFARRSPVPAREDGQTLTVRNAQALVTAARPSNHDLVLHTDGQFPTMLELVEATFTGRNFGWLPGERETAVHHIAKVVREDDGKSELAKERTFDFSYGVLFAEGPNLGKRTLMPPQYKLDVATATDQEIFERACQLVVEYVRSLKFQTDDDGSFSGSPYDQFLKKNGLPRQPEPVRPGLIEKEPDLAYARKLREAVDGLKDPQWVGRTEGRFLNHHQDFKFGPAELAGLKIFLSEAQPTSSKTVAHAGNCIACHAPPSFSDFGFHNTGATQEEYDQMHGKGAFAALVIPNLEERSKKPEVYLPASERHPKAAAQFEQIPDSKHPGYVDLGIWNVLFNPDLPNPQGRLTQTLVRSGAGGSPSAQLDASIARFKTPSVRDLGHSSPYLHNGSKDTIEDVLRFYIDASSRARKGQMRNAEPDISKISFDATDIAQMAAFLRSLNEDYDD